MCVTKLQGATNHTVRATVYGLFGEDMLYASWYVSYELSNCGFLYLI